MRNKKGQGISMTYIVIAALALVVLIVIILFFTGGLQTIFQAQKETVEGATEQQLEIWRNQCNLYCTMEKNEKGNCPNFCNYNPSQRGITYSCQGSKGIESLGVSCGGSSVSIKSTDKTKTISVSLEKEGERCECS